MNFSEINNKLNHINDELVQYDRKNNLKLEEIEVKMNQIQNAMIASDAPFMGASESKGFADYIRKGDISNLETKSLSSAEEEGGYLLTPALYNKILTGLNTRSPMRRLASVETISTNALDIIIEEGNFDCGWTLDAAERGDTNAPKLKQKRIMVHELYAQPKATQRLLDDAAINIEQWLNERLQDSFVKAENRSFLKGDGNNQPCGVLQNTEINKIHTASAEAVSPEDLLNLMNSLEEDYLANASFLMHRTTLSELQKLQDRNGRFIWQAALSEAYPETLFGIPVICSSDMPVISEGSIPIMIGDFKAGYKIVDRSGVAVMRDPYTEKPFVKFYAVKRVGGDVVNSNAIKFLEMSAA
jgi:HK97 family phage major capsid protein